MIDMDFYTKDIEILKNIKELDDRLFEIHSAEMFLCTQNTAVVTKIQDIDSQICALKAKINDLNSDIDKIKADILSCKKIENDLLVLREKNQDPEQINKINEDIDIQKLKITIFTNRIQDELTVEIKENENLLSKLENDKIFFSSNNNTAEKKTINAQVADINTSKRKLLSMLSATTQKEYEDLFDLDNMKHAISNIIDGFCDCCNLQTTLQQQESILQNNVLVKCEYCGCFLVNIENNVK